MPEVDTHFAVVALALAFDAMVGDPDWLWRRLPHPVAAFGALIGWLDRRLNSAIAGATSRRLFGFLAVAVVVGVATGVGLGIHALCASIPFGFALEAVVAATLLAQNSLYVHVAAVADALATGGLVAGRKAVSMIVGRDPDSLDEAGVARAAIESTAENFSDGVVAPLLWFVLLGLPGLAAYKSINTADSMIGHRTTRHADFGYAAAKLDDLINLVPARLSGLFIVLASAVLHGRGGASLRAMARDAGKHASPNAGWPEAAMAGGLGIELAGPRSYQGRLSADVAINSGGRREIGVGDIRAALRVYLAACVINAGSALAVLWVLA